ncbi:MAG: hypothetical protein DCC52_03105 [Chloroflexi bacterium]|nr:MAG: hypothetical protein DCC52_03105 [Chloroflexota bacterium]
MLFVERHVIRVDPPFASAVVINIIDKQTKVEILLFAANGNGVPRWGKVRRVSIDPVEQNAFPTENAQVQANFLFLDGKFLPLHSSFVGHANFLVVCPKIQDLIIAVQRDSLAVQVGKMTVDL